MHKLQVLNPGPFLKMKDIKPFITKDDNCIMSMVAGTQGVLKFSQRESVLVSKNGKRIASVDFSRGTPVMIVQDDKRIMVITVSSYERIQAGKNTTLIGSVS